MSRAGRVLRVSAAAALFFAGVSVGHFAGQKEPSGERVVLAEDPALASSWATPPTTNAQQGRDARAEARGGRRTLRRGGGYQDARVARVLSGASEDAAGDAVPEEDASLTAESAPLQQRPNWLLLAERGDFAAAFSEIDGATGFDAVLAEASAEELMTLADVARFAGRDARAIQALRQVTERFRTDPNAPLAAMMLGNLLGRAGDHAGAARAYELNRILSPGGDFAEDALAREFDLALRARDIERATQLLTEYELEFSGGLRQAAMRAELDELVARALPSPSGGLETSQRTPESEARQTEDAPADGVPPGSRGAVPQSPGAQSPEPSRVEGDRVDGVRVEGVRGERGPATNPYTLPAAPPASREE